MPEDMSEYMPEDMSDRMPEDISEYMPEDMPDRMPDWMPEDISEYMPEDMPDRMPEALPDRMPEDMPDHMPEDMPDRMPNRMSEDMSDRMPEDLPVRKCKNVMVGITRSKVIIFFFGRIYDRCISKFPRLAKLAFSWHCRCIRPDWTAHTERDGNPRNQAGVSQNLCIPLYSQNWWVVMFSICSHQFSEDWPKFVVRWIFKLTHKRATAATAWNYTNLDVAGSCFSFDWLMKNMKWKIAIG